MDLEKVEKLKSMANEWSLEKDNEVFFMNLVKKISLLVN